MDGELLVFGDWRCICASQRPRQGDKKEIHSFRSPLLQDAIKRGVRFSLECGRFGVTLLVLHAQGPPAVLDELKTDKLLASDIEKEVASLFGKSFSCSVLGVQLFAFMDIDRIKDGYDRGGDILAADFLHVPLSSSWKGVARLVWKAVLAAAGGPDAVCVRYSAEDDPFCLSAVHAEDDSEDRTRELRSKYFSFFKQNRRDVTWKEVTDEAEAESQLHRACFVPSAPVIGIYAFCQAHVDFAMNIARGMVEKGKVSEWDVFPAEDRIVAARAEDILDFGDENDMNIDFKFVRLLSELKKKQMSPRYVVAPGADMSEFDERGIKFFSNSHVEVLNLDSCKNLTPEHITVLEKTKIKILALRCSKANISIVGSYLEKKQPDNSFFDRFIWLSPTHLKDCAKYLPSKWHDKIDRIKRAHDIHSATCLHIDNLFVRSA